MAYDITEGNDLFVLEEINCRGEVKQNKFKVQVPLIKQAVEYALLTSAEQLEMEEEIDEFLDSFDNYSLTMLLSTIISSPTYLVDFDPTTFLTNLEEKGRCGVEGEEQIYGVGLTKELAYQAFCEVQVECSDEGWN